MLNYFGMTAISGKLACQIDRALSTRSSRLAHSKAVVISLLTITVLRYRR